MSDIDLPDALDQPRCSYDETALDYHSRKHECHGVPGDEDE